MASHAGTELQRQANARTRTFTRAHVTHVCMSYAGHFAEDGWNPLQFYSVANSFVQGMSVALCSHIDTPFYLSTPGCM